MCAPVAISGPHRCAREAEPAATPINPARAAPSTHIVVLPRPRREASLDLSCVAFQRPCSDAPSCPVLSLSPPCVATLIMPAEVEPRPSNFAVPTRCRDEARLRRGPGALRAASEIWVLIYETISLCVAIVSIQRSGTNRSTVFTASTQRSADSVARITGSGAVHMVACQGRALTRPIAAQCQDMFRGHQ